MLSVKTCLGARVESPAASDRRCLPPRCVAPQSHRPAILPRRALPGGRLTGLGATRDFHHGLLAGLVVAWIVIAGWPASAQTRTLKLIGTIPGSATTVHLHGTVAYVTDGPQIRFFDITNPASPTLLGSYTFPQNVYGVRVEGSVAYAAVDFYGLGVLDVSDPSAPTLLAALETGGQALSVDVSGTTAVLANRLSGLEVIDVSDPSAPVSRGAYFTEGYATDVDAVGSFAYVVDRPGGLSIIDLSKTGDPEAESTQGMAERPASVGATRLSPAAPGATLAGVMSTDSLLELFDVSDPSAPVAVSTYRDPERPPTGRNIATPRLRMEGPLAFIADSNPPFLLQVVDLSDPSTPTLVATYEPTRTPRDVSVSGSLVLVAMAGGEESSETPGVIILRLGP